MQAICRLESIVCLVAGLALSLVSAGPAGAAERQAREADSFVESIGINTHMAFNLAVYNSSQTELFLAELGVRYIRDGLPRSGTNALARYNNIYNNYGIRTLMVVDVLNSSPTTYTNMVNSSPAFIGVEGVNEPDIRWFTGTYYQYNGMEDNADANTYPATRAFQAGLAQTLAPGKVLVSPAMAYASETQHLLPMTAFNVRGMHSYPRGWPGSFNQAGIFSDALLVNNALGTSTPLWITETGYSTHTSLASGGQASVTLTAQAKYINRMLGENFNNPNIDKTFLYELYDEQNDPLDYHDNFGLMTVNRTRKPSFYALRNLIDLVEDPGDAFTPGTLDMTLTGGPSSVHSTLLQKRDGSFQLLLWNEAQSQNNRTSTAQPSDRNVAPVNVTLTLASLVQSIDVHFNLRNDVYSTLSYANLSSLVIAVPDEVIVVEVIIPEPGAAAAMLGAWPLLLRRGRPADRAA